MSRLARASESPVSSDGDESSAASSSEEEDGDRQDSSEEEEGSDHSTRQRRESASPVRQTSDQQEDYSDDDADDSSQPQAQQSQLEGPRNVGSALQQAGSSNATPAAVTTAGADPQFSLQQMTQQHLEHMHVAVRARPVPGGSSSSCWVVDPSTATMTPNGSVTAAKRKQALHSNTVLRSSNGNGLDGGQSRGLLGTAPSTPGSGFWDSTAPSGNSMGYKFDQVLDESAETAAVYSSCIQSLVQSALEGVNGTVLAYGEASAGITASHHLQCFQPTNLARLQCCDLQW